MCDAHAHASILLSPSPLMALRERGTKGVRVPQGVGSSARPEQSRRVSRAEWAGISLPHDPAHPYSASLLEAVYPRRVARYYLLFLFLRAVRQRRLYELPGLGEGALGVGIVGSPHYVVHPYDVPVGDA